MNLIHYYTYKILYVMIFVMIVELILSKEDYFAKL